MLAEINVAVCREQNLALVREQKNIYFFAILRNM